MMHNTDYTEEVVYPELAERLSAYPGAKEVTLEEFRHWASLVRHARYPHVLVSPRLRRRGRSLGVLPVSFAGPCAQRYQDYSMYQVRRDTLYLEAPILSDC